MNRWWGNKDESDKQASERSSRAARRTLASLNLVLSSDDDEFADADTSFHNQTIPQVDGDHDDTESMADAAELARQRALPFEDADFEDDPDAWKKEVKLKFDINDVKYWFNAVESQMRKAGINKQWSKKDAILPVLPDSVIEECKPILRLTEAEQGPHIYKDLKDEILNLYGPRDEDVFKKAIALRLTGKPSALGKQLIHILCPGAKPFQNCHCAKIVYGFWDAQLTPAIRSRLAGKKFTADTYSTLFKLADEAYLANGGSASYSPTVVASAAVVPSSSTPPTDTAQVAALQSSRGGRGGRGGGRGQGGGRGRGNGGSNPGQQRNNNNSNQNQNQQNRNQQNQSQQAQQGNKPHQRGPKASPDVPADACARHWKEGRQATYCSDPLVCSWAHIIVPRK